MMFFGKILEELDENKIEEKWRFGVESLST